MRKWTFMIGLAALTAGTLAAQTLQRKASIVNGGSQNGGRCTVEVTVDGAAEVEVRGDTATLRNTGGQSPQWRRFECTSAMPANPPNFRFAGVDGRGSQGLVRGPSNNSGALVRIQDSEGGSEGYTFDLFWGDGGNQDRFSQDRGRPGAPGFQGPQGPQAGPGPNDRRFDGDNRGPDYRGPDYRGSDNRGPYDRDRNVYDRDNNRGERFTTAQAIRVCQDNVRDRAVARFRTPNITFPQTSIDNNPGRQDWVMGELSVAKRFGRQDIYRFSCSVDFRTGQVRTAQIDQFDRTYYPRR